MQLTLSSTQEVLQSLDAAKDAAAQSSTLHAIKHSLTGHELRKIEYVRAGLLVVLDQLLSEALDESSLSDSQSQQEKDGIWTHAASIIGILANSGTSYTHAIFQTSLIQLLLSKLKNCTSIRLDLVILRCLVNVADNLPQKSEREWTAHPLLADLLYTKDNVARLASFLTEGRTHQQQQVFDTTLKLVCKTCVADKQRAILVEAQVLSRLCDEVQRFITQNKSLVWNSSGPVYVISHASHPSNCNGHISLVLETIAVLVETSGAYAKAFATHTGLLAAMSTEPLSQRELQQVGESGAAPAGVEIPLPKVPDAHTLNAARRSPFPPLSASAAASKRRTSSMRMPFERTTVIVEDGDQDENREYLIVPWLLHIVRTSRGDRRLVAARLLGILKVHGLVHPVRARSFASLLVPIIVESIDTSKEGAEADIVPAILALVVRDNEYLQRAAVEVKAIPKLATALKTTFDTTQDHALSLWWPRKLDEKLTAGEQGCSLGPVAPSRRMRQNMHRRQSILQALASLASDIEAHKTEIVDSGALVQIMQSLEPFHIQMVYGDDVDTVVLHGNSTGTIVAACAAVRVLTRSATTLRTKLVDADIVKPIVKLLHTSEPQVRIAATMVVANLAHDFSPMKQSIEPIMRKLCEQAHSANACLRKESIFALKALVTNSKNDLKRKIIEELGPRWIKHLIATDPHDVPPGEVIGLVAREYRKGSMIRLSSEATMEVDEPEEDATSEDFSVHTLQDDLEIQSELLGFLRNLTTGERPDEIVDYFFEQVDQEDFLQIIADRLKSGTAQRSIASSAPPAIIYNCLYILTHLCAADKKHRHVIYQNLLLMKQVSALLNNSDPFVRRAACWLVTNLVYANSNESIDALVQRAKELQKLGIVNQIRRMEKNDPVTDVKERAATAAECFNKLLNSS